MMSGASAQPHGKGKKAPSFEKDAPAIVMIHGLFDDGASSHMRRDMELLTELGRPIYSLMYTPGIG